MGVKPWSMGWINYRIHRTTQLKMCILFRLFPRRTDLDCHRRCISTILDKTDMTHQVPKVGGKCSGRLQLTQQRVTEMEVIPPGKSGMVLMMEQKQGANLP